MGLLDIFEIDTHTFATVLETCRGGDLESYLREHQVRGSFLRASSATRSSVTRPGCDPLAEARPMRWV